MTYYVGTMPVGEHLSHHGINGMRWGQRRYQNPDGSLTAAGRARYGNYMQRAAGARSLASQNRVAAGRTKSRVMKSIYGINDRYYTSRANKLTAKANRVKSADGRKSNPNRKRNLKRAAAVVGTAAAVAGAAYLGKRYGKNVAKAARNAGSRFSNMYNAHRARFPQKALPGAVKGSRVKNAFKSVGSTARKAAGAIGDAFRGVGYQARRTGAKAKNAARNLGYMAGNVKGNANRAASKAGTAAKNAAYKAGSKAKTTAARVKNAAKNAKNIPGNAKRVAYNLKNNKAYRRAAAVRGVHAAGKAAAGAYWYGVSRSYGASKKGAAAVGAARTFGGRRAALATSIAYGTGKKASQTYKAIHRRKKKKSSK